MTKHEDDDRAPELLPPFRRQAGPLALIPVGLADPRPQGFGVQPRQLTIEVIAAQLGAVAGGVFPHQSDRPRLHLRGNAVSIAA